MHRLSLGLEFSTQSVKIVVLNLDEKIVEYKKTFKYDETFSGYRIVGGVLENVDSTIRQAPAAMFLEALEHAFIVLNNDKIALGDIKVIKIDAMQHCSVYTKSDFIDALASLTPKYSLKDQLERCFSRAVAPIWEDRSPKQEASALTDALASIGGGITALTGNKAELRFPAAQIMYFAHTDPVGYKASANIQLLSAFFTSILAGKLAHVDTGDGWGTNLNTLDIMKPSMNGKILNEIDKLIVGYGVNDSISAKVGDITHYDETIGVITPYFVQKYGVNKDAIILAGTGDNPATLLGCGGNIVISLGSSYTVNGAMDNIVPSTDGEYNIFGYTKNRAMALTVFTNGSKIHDEFIRRYLNLTTLPTLNDWKRYVECAGGRAVSECEPLMLPYLFDESVPIASRGFVRDGFDDKDAQTNIRSLLISQTLSLKLHSSHLTDAKSICVVGGGSKNPFFLTAIADAFGAETYTIENADYAAPLGCAISGAKAILGANSYAEVCRHFVQRDSASVAKPDKANTEIYAVLMKHYETLERKYNSK